MKQIKVKVGYKHILEPIKDNIGQACEDGLYRCMCELRDRIKDTREKINQLRRLQAQDKRQLEQVSKDYTKLIWGKTKKEQPK